MSGARFSAIVGDDGRFDIVSRGEFATVAAIRGYVEVESVLRDSRRALDSFILCFLHLVPGSTCQAPGDLLSRAIESEILFHLLRILGRKSARICSGHLKRFTASALSQPF